MRHKGVDKAEMAERMLDAAGRAFRKNGFNGVGVDGLAKVAGVTSGAFYSHFKSKGAAFEKALVAGLNEVLTRMPEIQQQEGAQWVDAFARYYLGKAHRADLECGCAMASLTGDVVRADKATHTLYEKKMLAIVSVAAQGLADGTEAERKGRAWALLGTLIGGVNLARAVQNSAVANTIAEATIQSAIQIAGATQAVAPV